jgi:hypothetical protein
MTFRFWFFGSRRGRYRRGLCDGRRLCWHLRNVMLLGLWRLESDGWCYLRSCRRRESVLWGYIVVDVH